MAGLTSAASRRRYTLRSGMDHIAPLVIVGFVIALIGWSIVVLISRTPQ
jgi:hypothetical protein